MVYEWIAGLIQKGLETQLIEPEDKIYVRNQVMHLLGLESFTENVEYPADDMIPDLLDKLVNYAVDHHIIEDVLDEKEILSANIMNCFTARPSVVNEIFNNKYEVSPKSATDYFYSLSKNNNYIQMNRIRKNSSYQTDTPYGKLEITINLSKPEKDPKQIEREKEMKKTIHYPNCLLCVENEGYNGRLGHPARANLRIIDIPLLGENWYFQYSPYVYYNEHSILLSEEHRDMKIDKLTFERLLTFTEKFPHYFIGSNADLPIVGGSILSHDHYQAGNYQFAMAEAEKAFPFTLNNHPEVDAAVLKWPMSAIRLHGYKINKLVDAADYILRTWREYSDEQADILAYTNGKSHNTITPIARNRKDHIELDLVLRNNRTSPEHPLGIFHPHEDVHHIKKENIGLIEVMGLAVLPPRLKGELSEIKNYLLDKSSHVTDYHQDWANQLKENYGTLTDNETAETILQKELGKKFIKVLEDASVYKDRPAFERFIKTLNK
ncbi:UDP-glucose--hexose-1-phosphate uridylyltransferase [Oceanobacillus timonensis]|uniref:UDP-glucose--hexose-1-phosphate uridylyltransferase n=1 Tax=Oceanobacillus timonensis TaxID=1926285 RepID=UPI0009BAD4A1|nr:UDP-glucose--hexose-1-phosphate uridylyltransferase [Oceanobacillus timonensis]